MTMKIIVINDDADPTRAAAVEVMRPAANAVDAATRATSTETQIIEAGKHKEFYVYDTQFLTIKEKAL